MCLYMSKIFLTAIYFLIKTGHPICNFMILELVKATWKVLAVKTLPFYITLTLNKKGFVKNAVPEITKLTSRKMSAKSCNRIITQPIRKKPAVKENVVNITVTM